MTPHPDRPHPDRPEFSRPERVDRIGVGERAIDLVATEAERAAVAARFDLTAINRLEARFVVRRGEAGITARGRVSAEVVQACSVTGEPIAVAIDEEAALLFVPGIDAEGEVELNADALDTIVYQGDAIDLGEAAAETMALALDPFLRSPAAAEALRAAGVVSEEEARPVSKFAGLKDLLGKS